MGVVNHSNYVKKYTFFFQIINFQKFGNKWMLPFIFMSFFSYQPILYDLLLFRLYVTSYVF